MQKPLFIPLKKEYFEEFEAGTKTKEYRVYGPRWNERTCTPRREVTLSCGYGKHRRLKGRVKSFDIESVIKCRAKDDLFKIYGVRHTMIIAVIEIEII